MRKIRLPEADWFYHVEALHEYGVDVHSRTIFVHPMETDDDVDAMMAKQFLKNLSLLEASGHDGIVVRMITCGGSWDYGMAMYDAIAASPCHITTVSYAHARSMSSIIPQAADHRIIMPDAYCMIHWGTDVYEGASHGLSPYARFAELANKRMLDVYYDRCRHSDFFHDWPKPRVMDYLEDKMNRSVEWYMTAKEAVFYGFMDEVKE